MVSQLNLTEDSPGLQWIRKVSRLSIFVFVPFSSYIQFLLSSMTMQFQDDEIFHVKPTALK